MSAVQKLDSLGYLGNMRRTLLQIQALIPAAYPTLMNKADRDQMSLLHLMKLLPPSCKHELVKMGVTTLDTAVKTVAGIERAERALGDHTGAGVHRVVAPKDCDSAEKSVMNCFVCGLMDHIRVNCPFKHDICGNCNRRGHLSVVCRQGQSSRPSDIPGRGGNKGNGRGPARGQWQARGPGPAPALQPLQPRTQQQLPAHPWPQNQWPQQQWPQEQWPQEQRPMNQWPQQQPAGGQVTPAATGSQQ